MPRLLVALALAGAACFSPTWEARLAGADGGPRGSDAGSCAPSCGASCCTKSQACIDGKCVSCGCGARECGIDGCGNACGACPFPKVCSDGVCTSSCTPACGARVCGEDGCGGSCGACQGSGAICANGACVCDPAKWCGQACCGPGESCLGNACTPCTCAGRECGADACGNSCGVCAFPLQCVQGSCLGCAGDCGSRQCGLDDCGNSCGDCPPGQSCDWSSGQCVSPSCEPSSCQPGQGCFDPTTLGPGEVCTCLPADNGATDTCASLGLACDWDWYDPQPAACRKPREFETCQIGIGCDPGLDCLTVSGTSYCLQPCKKSADCTSAVDTCEKQLQSHCWYNVCADPSTSSSDRAKYFKPCAASKSGDGICLPVLSQDASGAPIDLGLCSQTGSAPAGGQCSMQAGRTRAGELCPQGQYCFPVEPDPARPGEQLGACHPVCNAAPQPNPVAGCDASSTCVDMSGASAGTLEVARLGMCDASCQLFSQAGCPLDAMGELQTCFPRVDGTAGGYCWPVMPGASAPGSACQAIGASGDLRSDCQVGSFCSQDGSCVQLCDTLLCPIPGQACAACPPGQPSCVGYQTPVGACAP